MTSEPATQKTIDQFIRENPGLRIEVSTGKRQTDPDGWEHDRYRVKIRKGAEELRLTYRKGIGHHGNPPQLDEILDAIRTESYDVDDFNEWAASLGYDPDSRKAYKTWEACVKQARDARRLLGVQKFDELLECEGL